MLILNIKKVFQVRIIIKKSRLNFRSVPMTIILGVAEGPQKPQPVNPFMAEVKSPQMPQPVNPFLMEVDSHKEDSQLHIPAKNSSDLVKKCL
jgi:hypothetical protein